MEKMIQGLQKTPVVEPANTATLSTLTNLLPRSQVLKHLFFFRREAK